MAGVSTRSLAVRALLALLLVSGSLMHVRAEENIDDLEKDGAAIDNQESEECPSPPDSRLECNLDFQDCLDDPSECTYLDLMFSSLTGTIPSIIGELTALTELVLDVNDLTGSMPTELGLLTALTSLYLGDNDLTGSMPTQLGLLQNMVYLGLHDNDLTGTMPTELMRLTNMNDLDVSQNIGLVGCRPSVGNVGTSYDYDETNLGTACPSLSPTTVAPTAPTVAPTAPTVAPTVTTVAPTVTTVAPTVTTVAPTGSPTICGGGAPVDPDPSLDTDGRNDIMRAAMSGNQTDMTTALADSLQFIDLMDNTKFGYSALMLAAQYDHQDMARMLLDAGAGTCLLTETDSSEENNWSNVMVAAWYGDEEIMTMFLTASTEHLDTPANFYQMAPLHAAVSRGHSRTTSVLASFGANVNALDSDNMTPLHYAVRSGHFKCAKTLLTAGADKHLVDDAGNTACDYAAEGVLEEGAAERNINHDIQALLGSCAVPP